MEPHARYTLVGSLVLILIGLSISVFFWLNKGKDSAGKKFYTIYFKDTPVNGLQIDSAVTMRGIRIGSVVSSAIPASDIELVRVLIQVENQTPIKRDTKAVIQRNLLTGLANVDLVNGSKSAPLLEEVLLGEKYPVIAEGSTSLQQIQNTMPEVIERANVLLNRANQFFSEENKQSFSKALVNIEIITAKLADDQGAMHKALSQIAELSSDVRTFVHGVDDRTREVSESISRASTALSREATALVSDFRRAARGFSVVLEGMENPRKLLIGPSDSVLGPGEEKK